MSLTKRESGGGGGGVHMGTLLDFSAETNPPLPDGNSRRTYTARVVFQGNRVINQDWEAAMFQDWGNAPATMEAPRSIGCYGCLPGHAEEQNDARHAYTQAFLKGTHTWDCLPKQQRPMACHHMRRPVAPLLQAMYGHPDSGTDWYERCNDSAEPRGFAAIIKGSWPGTYYHHRLRLMLVIDVDDLKIGGPFSEHGRRLGIAKGGRGHRRFLARGSLPGAPA